MMLIFSLDLFYNTYIIINTIINLYKVYFSDGFVQFIGEDESKSVIERINPPARNEFPDYFHFGVASSAYECEGAWDVDDKGETVWDHVAHSYPNLILDHSSGDISSDFYHKYPYDITLASNIGLSMMKISLSWSRLLPEGYSNRISESGVSFYNKVIDKMLENNIIPMISLFDGDMPYCLQQLGGWSNSVIIDIFVDYAKIAFSLFGNKVKYWATVNDPVKMCRYGYGGTDIPAVNLSGVADYLCGHHVLLAHAKVYELYHRKYDGKLGILHYYTWFEPARYYSMADIVAAEMAQIFYNDWLTQPIFGHGGDYPSIMKMSIGYNSYDKYFSSSRLPSFSFSDLVSIKRSADFLGINYYTAIAVENNGYFMGDTSFDADAGIRLVRNSHWSGEMNIKNTPWALGKLLKRLNDKYLLPEIWITGNGYADSGNLADWNRAVYHHDHLNEVLKAIQNGINIRGYLVKSLTDGFEGLNGYETRFGLVHVDFDDVNRTRTFKLSLTMIADVCKTKQLRSPKEVYGAFLN